MPLFRSPFHNQVYEMQGMGQHHHMIHECSYLVFKKERGTNSEIKTTKKLRTNSVLLF
jgi:hypothetical protein